MSDKNLGDELIGQTIAGRYRIISRLGAGGMGVAYRAWDEEDGVPVVTKIPKKAFLDDPKFTERFAREIRLLQGLRHPHIVPIIDVGEHEELPYVAMRFLPGGSLSDRRLRDADSRTRPNPPGMLHLWLTAMADALDHVHANGVVHRDVKPANIFFDAFWSAFLGDFGIAKIVEESESFDRENTLTATNMGIGTPDYMGPELFTPKPVLDGRTDQYALAVTVYEMLAGTRPFTGSTAHIVVEVTTMQAPRLDRTVRGLPSSLVQAVLRGLAKNPEERFPTCREFAYHVLQDVPLLADEPDIARLLCPSCSNILKLPVKAAGQRGKCPKCQTQMKVADDLGALWLLDEARRQRESMDSATGIEFDSDAANADSSVDKDSLREFRPVSGTTPVGWPRQSWSSIFTWIDSHGFAVAGMMTVLAAALWLIGGARNDRQPDLDSKNAEIRRLSEQLSEQSKQLDSVSKAKGEAETQLAAARTDLKVTQAEAQDIKTQLAVRSSPPSDPSPLPADAQEILARPPFENSVGMKLKLIPPGTFMMGSENGDHDEKPVHEVRITKPFYIGVYEVTNAQWKRVMGGEPPSNWKEDDRPVEMVTWDNAVGFCQKLSAMPEEQKAGRVYRLPTEAEWEYACRAGTTTHWSSGDNGAELGDFAWFGGNAGVQTHPVGTRKSNPWGLHDMHGNVWEWCADWYGSYPEEAVTDPTAVEQNSLRVPRGGGWDDSAWRCRSANRNWGDPSLRPDSLGFRLALSPSDSTPREAEQPGAASRVDTAAATIPPPEAEKQVEPAATAEEILARPPAENSIGMKLKLIPPGTFLMGSNDGDPDEMPAHEVKITKPFHLGVYEVTNAQWQAVMGRVPSAWRGDDHPVEQVSWTDAIAFCRTLTALPAERAAGRVYRLPTEAEWEYACRAGTNSEFSFGGDRSLLPEYGWVSTNSGGQTRPVGLKKPNPWGLYDMHGNVWEWCADGYGPYNDGAATDPAGLATAAVRVYRGGNWGYMARESRSAKRKSIDPEHRDHYRGFRVAMDAQQQR
jgi:formylglycine-generating enzyme required for sulfatase activity